MPSEQKYALISKVIFSSTKRSLSFVVFALVCKIIVFNNIELLIRFEKHYLSMMRNGYLRGHNLCLILEESLSQDHHDYDYHRYHHSPPHHKEFLGLPRRLR